MSSYETTATVEPEGQVHLAGVPFETGTAVAVTVKPAQNGGRETATDGETLAAARDRMRELFRSVTGFRNSPRIPREELYERGRLH